MESNLHPFAEGGPTARTVAAALPRAAPLARRATLALAGGLIALSASAAPPPVAKPLGCLIEPDRVADVGSQVVGLVESIEVERGQLVKKNQLLLGLRSEVERANASVAATRAKVDADVLAAKASVELAEQKMRRAQALVKENFVSNQAVEQAAGELELARQKFSQTRSQKQIWVEEQRVADAQLGLRSVRSPFDGVVVERFVNLGERVEDRPLLRVAVIDPLRVELMVPTAQFGMLSPGDKLTIRPELPGVESVVATVRFVDRVLDAASNSFRVRLTLPNPGNKLPAGLRCKADLPKPGAGPDAAAAAKPANVPNAAAATARPATSPLLPTMAGAEPKRAPARPL